MTETFTPNQSSPDTSWTLFRWWIAVRLSLWALRIAPAGTARDRWLEVNQEWSRECRAAWALRYPQDNETEEVT